MSNEVEKTKKEEGEGRDGSTSSGGLRRSSRRVPIAMLENAMMQCPPLQ